MTEGRHTSRRDARHIPIDGLIPPLYIDDDIIVVNKPAGLLSVPGRYLKDSCVSRLEERYGEILVIHRLDQDTSGILVFARDKKSAEYRPAPV